MKGISASYGKDNYRVTGMAVLCGEDVSFSFIGGTSPHIGAASLAVYEPARDSATVSTMTVYTHRDDQLAAQCAKAAASALKCTVTVSVGIHVDDAAPSDLKILTENFQMCYKMLLEKMQKEKARQAVL